MKGRENLSWVSYHNCCVWTQLVASSRRPLWAGTKGSKRLWVRGFKRLLRCWDQEVKGKALAAARLRGWWSPDSGTRADVLPTNANRLEESMKTGVVGKKRKLAAGFRYQKNRFINAWIQKQSLKNVKNALEVKLIIHRKSEEIWRSKIWNKKKVQWEMVNGMDYDYMVTVNISVYEWMSHVWEECMWHRGAGLGDENGRAWLWVKKNVWTNILYEKEELSCEEEWERKNAGERKELWNGEEKGNMHSARRNADLNVSEWKECWQLGRKEASREEG